MIRLFRHYSTWPSGEAPLLRLPLPSCRSTTHVTKTQNDNYDSRGTFHGTPDTYMFVIDIYSRKLNLPIILLIRLTRLCARNYICVMFSRWLLQKCPDYRSCVSLSDVYDDRPITFSTLPMRARSLADVYF